MEALLHAPPSTLQGAHNGYVCTTCGAQGGLARRRTATTGPFQSVSFHVAFFALLWDPCLVSVWARTAIPCPLAHAGHAYKHLVRSMVGLPLHRKATAGAAAQSVSFHVVCLRPFGTPAGESLGIQWPPMLSATCRAYICIIYAAQGGLVRPRAGCSCPTLPAYLSSPTGTP